MLHVFSVVLLCRRLRSPSYRGGGAARSRSSSVEKSSSSNRVARRPVPGAGSRRLWGEWLFLFCFRLLELDIYIAVFLSPLSTLWCNVHMIFHERKKVPCANDDNYLWHNYVFPVRID